jgi:hypothetical protein
MLTTRTHRTQRRTVCTFAMATVISTILLGGGACGPQPSGGSSDPSTPRAIAGGSFEASGVAYVPGSNTILFVDDGRTREIFLMELTPQGAQRGTAVAVPLGADVTDLEGITSDGRHFYVVGSQSKKSGFEGDGLVRFTFDVATRRAAAVERIQGLKAWLAANVAELRGTERRTGDDVLNIEAIAWDPAGERLLLGLRAPVVDGQALIVPVKLVDPARGFTRENLRVDGAAIRVNLDGAGIRSLEHDEQAKAFRIISGAGLNDENRDFRVVEWDGLAGSTPRAVSSYDRRFKPEGIVRAAIDGRSVSVIVFDTGRFLVTD